MEYSSDVKKLIKEVTAKPVPQHVAVIMDGNGRWAKLHGLARSAGHRYGVEKLKELLTVSKDVGIKYVTAYAFSTENWRRPKEEVDLLMQLIIEFIHREIDNIKREGARIHVLGDYSILPEESRKAVQYAIDYTRENTQLHLNVALNYGGRAEIVDACRAIAKKVSLGELKVEDIDEELISNNLYTAGMPDPDLIIRTAGELRMSNFLTYQSAYSEFWASDSKLFWPDFGVKSYLNAILEYQMRERRFGGV